ncbi:MAG: aminotransferase class V-fold PLP-dependent enzyme [Pseudomonadota bacterium]
MKKPIYLDNAATTPPDPRVVSRMLPYLYDRFGNAASRTHARGWGAEEAVEIAREQVAMLIGCEPAEIVWTSGATEANNLALKGIAQNSPGTHRHIVTAGTEHSSVLEPLRALQRQGFSVSVLAVEPSGLLDPERFAAALQPHTLLASVMWVNNETGVIQDIAALAAICRARGVLLHVDAAQAAGKIGIDWSAVPIDLMSISAHKIHGPQGIGALVVRKGLAPRLAAQMHGGGQERGLRGGTLPLPQIVGCGEAYRLARNSMATDNERIRALRDRLWAGIGALDGVRLNGDPEQRVPHHLNVSFSGIEADALLAALASELAVSSGAACASDHVEPSHVLLALGRSEDLALSSIRFSLGRFTNMEEIERAIEIVRAQVGLLRSAAPVAPGKALDDDPDDPDCPMKRLRRRAQARKAAAARRLAASTGVSR